MPAIPTPADPKPFVQLACVCEKLLIEPDNVVSLIRVVDTFTLEFLPGVEMPAGMQFSTKLTTVICLKSGDVVGEYEIGLRLNTPDDKQRPVRRYPVEFRGQEFGVNVAVAFTIQDPKVGLYWFDVLWGEEVLTRIPFRLKSTEARPTDDVDAPNETVMH